MSQAEVVMWTALVSVLACGGPAQAGELWLEVEGGGQEQVKLRLPAGWLAEAQEPVSIETRGGTVDLQREARALSRRRVGARQRWTLAEEEPVQLSLSHEARVERPVRSMTLSALGSEGRGLSLSLPLEPGALGPARASLDAQLDIDGLDIELDEALCAQLRRAGPTVLLEVRGLEGGGLRIATE